MNYNKTQTVTIDSSILRRMIKRRIKTYKQNNQRAFMAIKMAYKMRSDRFIPPVSQL
nr:hypothetical protein [uncultured Draconibacterium sp.]